MNLKKILTSFFSLKNIFVISLFILIFISSISYRITHNLAETTELVANSYKARIQLEQVFSYLKDAETGQRGFIITHDTVFLHPYYTAHEKVNNSFAELKKTTAANLQQQNNLDSLFHLINLRFSRLEDNLTSSVQIPVEVDLIHATMLKGKDNMDNIRLLINRMLELEMIYLQEREAKYDRDFSISPLFTLMLLLFSLLVFSFSYWKINKDLNIFKTTNAHLLITNESIKHAEEIGAFSTWQWNLETNKLTYSDNQYLLLGCEPQSFEPTIEKFLEFVHPNDKHIITEGVNSAIHENKYSDAYFRIIRKDGEVRFFKAKSKLIKDANGKKMLIGINSDVTEQHLIKLSLEERNRELEQSNKELASFNQVASHDLQEPLRIIQTYISRFNEKETAALSEKGKEFFTKIKIAVTRMRTLINALLLFSRTNKTDKVFEKTDLNLLLENSVQDLAQAIEEKNAVIQSVKLPTLNVIPFQIQQLFTNLIGNSIKYGKANVAPVIKIECEKVIAKDQPELKTESTKKYFKISISDNGLGFEPQYAESIFKLFQRLHHDNEYQGTGIGLSICKKIVENHAGFIFAEGKPNVGAIFSVFLPQ
jgi:signal transduction histidine kinase/CHASE3 domain sensor protein